MDDGKVIGAIREAVTVRPGDTLVVCLGDDVTADYFEACQEAIRRAIPDGIECVVLGGNIRQVACVRASGR